MGYISQNISLPRMGLLPGASPAFLVRSVSILRRSHYGVFKQLCRDITGSVTAAGPSSTYLKKRGSRSCEAEGTPVISPSSQEITRSWSDRAQVLQTLQSSAGPVKKKKKKHKAKLSDIPRDAARYLASSKNSSASQPLDSPTSDADLERTADKRKFKDRKEVNPLSECDQDDLSRKPLVAPYPLPYTRRVEGLLFSSQNPVLIELPPLSEQQPIARLSHGLERVLFNPGVHWLQDPRSRVYNFTPWLENVPNVQDFDFDRIGHFIPSSRDEDLRELAKRERCKFAGSTSSLTGILSQIYFLISDDKGVDTSILSRSFQREPMTFTSGQRMAKSVILKYKEDVYTIDSDTTEGSGEKNILLWMGTLLEKFLTQPQEQFARLMRCHPIPQDIDQRREAYRYAKSGTIVMRSQLDCRDGRLPGTGVFDIKTRAALPLRMDLLNFEENSGYLIRSLYGRLESFEREYYDLIRSAFLKYSLQARIGNMDGVLVAYHNTAQIFGFQYIPLEEMEERLYGGKGCGDRVFEKCVGILESVADEVIRTFPEQSLRCTFETLKETNVMNVWIEPAEWSGTGIRPIAQLDVTSLSYLDQTTVKGFQAVSTIDAPWTLHWTVSRSAATQDIIHSNLGAAKDRLFRAYNLPSGIGFEDMAEYWEMLNFSGKESVGGAEPPYSPDNFQEARPNILMLRALAKAGREETSKMALETMGAKKVVWYEADGLDAVHGVTLTPAQSDKVSRTIFPDNGSPSVDVAREVIGPQVVNSADTSGSDYTLSGESNRQSPAPMDAAGEATSIKEGCPPSHSSSGSAVDIIASSERNGEMEESSEVEVEEAPRLLSTESSNKPASPTVPEPAVEVESTSVNSADQKASTTPAGGETLPLPESRYMAVSGDSLGDAARLLPFPQTDTLLPSGHEPAFCLTLIDDISGDIDSTLLSPSPAEHLSHRDLESTDATQASTLDAPCADLADAMATTDTSTAGSTMSAPGSEIHGEPVLKSSL